MPSCKETFTFNIYDTCPVPYSVMEIVLNENGKPIDGIYRYCNQAFAVLKRYDLNALVDHSLSELYPVVDFRALQVLYQASYENKSCKLNATAGKNYDVIIMPIGKAGYCCTIYYETDKNRQINDADEDAILKKLFVDYVSLYHIELNSGKFEILKIGNNTNVIDLINKDDIPLTHFDAYAQKYAQTFVDDEERKEFLDWHTCKSMKEAMSKTDKISYYYHSTSLTGNHSYYEAYAVKGKVTDTSFHIFLGYRNIDNILSKEKAIQQQLQNALNETRKSHEIIASIAKAYQYISIINIQADTFEEIYNKDRNTMHYAKSGKLSTGNSVLGPKVVAEEYLDIYMQFTDISTLAERMKNEETLALEYRMKNGDWHKLRFIEKRRDENGNVTHVLCAVRSISDTKKREEDLLYQVAEAKKDSAVKSRFLSNMSHDIRTPMNGIIGMIEKANSHPEDMQLQQECRDKIIESSKFLLALVNNILDMTKLESGDIALHEIPFDLIETVIKTNSSYQSLAEEKGIEYVVDWEKTYLKHTSLIGDPVYVEKLMGAILSNAIKFTEPGGTIHIWGKETECDNHTVTYSFGCEDTGIGMSKEFLPHAFDQFTQEHEDGRTKYEGSGLGLAIAKKAVERLGGTIDIQSEKGKGTSVFITLPFRLGKQESTEHIIDTSDISLEGLHILVVEDNELNAEIAKFMLEDNGMIVDCAFDGIEAVQKYTKADTGYYDCILMDIMMPHMNGWDTARKIRSSKKTDSRTIPIIAMSANSFSDDINKSYLSGMNAHLSKPLDITSLLNELKKAVYRAHTPKEES